MYVSILQQDTRQMDILQRREIFTDEAVSPELFHCLIPPSALAQTFRNCSGGKKSESRIRSPYFFRKKGEKTRNLNLFGTQCETETDEGGVRERENADEKG